MEYCSHIIRSIAVDSLKISHSKYQLAVVTSLSPLYTYGGPLG